MALPNVRRPDFSNSLVHLTRDKSSIVGVTPKRTPAFEVLKQIIQSGRINGSGNGGYVKGSRTAVCLSEIPLSMLSQFVAADGKPRYSSYGIAMSKAGVFAEGGRPVIYLPDHEADWIPEQEKWRHVRFEAGSVDFTFEREWRVPGDLKLNKLPGIYILVQTTKEADTIKASNHTLKNIRGILPMEHLQQML